MIYTRIYTAAIAASLAFALSACGGGGDDTAQLLATDTSTASGGDDDVLSSVRVAPLVGPTITLEQAGCVKAHIDLQWTQPIGDGPLTLSMWVASPVETQALYTSGLAMIGDFTVCLPAGEHALYAQALLRAPGKTLGDFTARATWRVTSSHS